MSNFLIEDNEFKGNLPEIEIRESSPKHYFHYNCMSNGNNLGLPCTINCIEPCEICYIQDDCEIYQELLSLRLVIETLTRKEP